MSDKLLQENTNQVHAPNYNAQSKQGTIKATRGKTVKAKQTPVKAKQTPIKATRGKTVQAKQTPVKAKQTPVKATRGNVIQAKKSPSTSKKWTYSQFEQAYTTPVDLNQLTDEEKKYFAEYEKRAQVYLDRAGSKWGGKTKITGAMFANAARWSYLHYGKDMSKVVPVEFALAQAQFESHLGMTGRSASKNPFNIGEYNKSTASFVSKIKDGEMGVAMYYHLMAEDYLSARSADQLLENFINERGQRYQVDDGGVSDKSYEADVKKQMGFIGRYADKNGAKFTAPTPTGKSTTGTNKTPKTTNTNPVEAVYKKYSDGKIDMIALGTALIPFASSHASDITKVFDNLPWIHRDNLAFVMSNHSSDSKLASFDRKILQRMSSELGAVSWLSSSYQASQKQKKKVDKVLGGQSKPTTQKGSITASALNVRKGPGTSFGKNGVALSQGTQVNILEEKDGWYRIGKDQWVSGKYVAVINSQKKSSSTPVSASEAAKKRIKLAKEANNNTNDTRTYGWDYSDKTKGNKVDCSHFIREIEATYHSEEARKLKQENGFLTPEQLNKYNTFFTSTRMEVTKQDRGTKQMAMVLKNHGTYSTSLSDVREGDYVFIGKGKSTGVSGISHIMIITEIKTVGGKKQYHFIDSGRSGAKLQGDKYVGGKRSVRGKYHMDEDGVVWKGTSDVRYFKGAGRPEKGDTTNGSVAKSVAKTATSNPTPKPAVKKGEDKPAVTTTTKATNTAISTTSAPTSANFKIEEFACNDGTAVPPEYYPNVKNLMAQLEILRSEMGNNSITINSSYRTPTHNASVGGASNSQHLYAKAADIVVKGYTPKQVHAKIKELTKAGKMTQGGLGLYNSFVHYDIRGTKARWDFSS